MSRRVVVAALTATLGAVTLNASQELTKADAVRMEQKLGAIMARGAAPPRQARPLHTSFTEREVNAYFKFNSQTFPTGVVNPRLAIADGGRLEAQATVDLNAIKKSKVRGYLDPMNFLFGSMDLKIIGSLKANNGMGTLAIDSATLGGIPVPKMLLQEVIAFYTKSPELPDGFDLDKPFALPVGIREVVIQRGAATIVQ